jgi:hypothetical protein
MFRWKKSGVQSTANEDQKVIRATNQIFNKVPDPRLSFQENLKRRLMLKIASGEREDIKASRITQPNIFKRQWLKPSLVACIAGGVLIAMGALYFSGFLGTNKSGDFWTKVSAAAEGMTSYHVIASLDNAPNYDISFVSPGVYDFKYYLPTGFVRTEVVVNHELKYVRSPELTGASGVKYLYIPDNVLLSKDQVSALLDSFQETTQLPDEKIGAIDCLHYSGTVEMTQGHSAEYEVWIGKSDYLARRIETDYYSTGANHVPHWVYQYIFNETNIEIPIDSSGNTLPGWYLQTDATFSASAVFDNVITAKPDQWVYFDVQLALTNVSQEAISDLRIFGASTIPSMAAGEGIAQDPLLSPGQQGEYHLTWSLHGGITTYVLKDNGMGSFDIVEDTSDAALNRSVTLFIEYKNSAGVNCFEVLKT